jgi:hypothetical protein
MEEGKRRRSWWTGRLSSVSWTAASLDVVTFLEASFFRVMGATFYGARAAGWVDVLGFHRCASAARLFLVVHLPHEA